MKTCKKCGKEIINGVNGCMLAGDICFDCQPWDMKPTKSPRAVVYTYEELCSLESLCIDDGEE